MWQEELKGVKQQLASRGDEVQQLQTQLATAQTETRDLKERYAKLATQAQELQQKLAAEVTDPSIASYFLELYFQLSISSSCLHSHGVVSQMQTRLASKSPSIVWYGNCPGCLR